MSIQYVSPLTVALCLAAASSGTLSAGIIASASASWSGFTCTAVPDNFCDPPFIPVGESITRTGTNVTVSVSLPDPGTGFAGASGVARYGSVFAAGGGNAGVTGNIGFSPLRIGDVEGEASASFSDTVTIFGRNGTGMLAVDIGVECRHYDGHASAVLNVGTARQVCDGNSFHQYDLSTVFTFGVPLEINGRVFASGRDFSPFDPGNGAADGTATARLFGLVVSDANGQRLTGLTYSSGSAARYAFQDAVFVPEPGTMGVVLIVLLFGVALRRGRSGTAFRLFHSARASASCSR